jgi:hypothetical protein
MANVPEPAVALMPDVTMKPLRSKANAIINLMGAAGGIIVLVMGTVFGTGRAFNALMDYKLFFACIAGLMLVFSAHFSLAGQRTEACSGDARGKPQIRYWENGEDKGGRPQALKRGADLPYPHSRASLSSGFSAITRSHQQILRLRQQRTESGL